MNLVKIFKNSNILIIFLVLVITVLFLQFTLLDLALKIGFKPDDWILYFSYKSLGQHPLSKVTGLWAERGIYTTYQVYYMGLLEKLVGFDYRSFQIVNVIFKSLATVAVFPLMLVIFKNKSLAILTTFFFAISYAAVGPLEFVVKGSDYVAIFWMCIFLTVYYLIINKYPRNFLLLGIGLLLLVLTLGFSPIRLFPLLFLLPLTEIYLVLRHKSLDNLRNTLIRMLVFYLPFIILILYSPGSILGFMQSPLGIFKRIIEGNWHLLLSPFSGIGYTFITNEYWGKIFGSLSVDSLEKYIYFLLGGPTVIFGVLTVIVAYIQSRQPRRFFLFAFTLNFILEILVFFIATHSKYLPGNYGLHYEQSDLYSALFGIYILVLGLACFLEWIKDGKNNLLMALWMGVLFLFVFTFAIWAFAPFGTSFSPTSYYLVVSSLGSSIFISAFLISIYNKVIRFKKRLLKIISLVLLLVLVIFIFVMNSQEIHSRFLDLLANGRAAREQQLLQGKFKERLGNFNNSKPALFYFDSSDLSGEGGSFYSEGFLGSFPFWMHFQGNKLTDGCLEVLYLNEYRQLLPYIREQDGERGFFFRSLCVENGKASYKDIFYKPENFYAFKIKSKDFINIKNEVLKELEF